MKTTFAMAALTLTLGVTAALPATADERNPPADKQRSQLPTMRVDDIKGTNILNERGESLGDIKSVVRSKDDKKVFAVLSVGGFLGIGSHDVAIPLQDLAKTDDHFMAPPNTTKDQLEKIPEIDKARFDELPGDQVVTLGPKAMPGGGAM